MKKKSKEKIIYFGTDLTSTYLTVNSQLEI